MDTEPVNIKRKRPSRGVRKHNRRLKQEARKTAIPGNEIKKKRKRVA